MYSMKSRFMRNVTTLSISSSQSKLLSFATTMLAHELIRPQSHVVTQRCVFRHATSRSPSTSLYFAILATGSLCCALRKCRQKAARTTQGLAAGTTRSAGLRQTKRNFSPPTHPTLHQEARSTSRRRRRCVRIRREHAQEGGMVMTGGG